MKILKIIFVACLMMMSLNCYSQYDDPLETTVLNIKDIHLSIQNDSTIIITVDKSIKKNIIRNIDIIEVLPNCNEYCLNLNNKSEIVIKSNSYEAKLNKPKGKYIIKVTFQETTNEGIKKMFFEEKYFDII